MKHFLSKKRIDQKRDDTRSKRLQKVGKTALAITAGAVFFNHSEYGRRLLDSTEALIPITKSIKADMIKDTKNIRDLGTWKKTIEKHIGKNGSEFKKILSNIEKNRTNNSSTLNLNIKDFKLFRKYKEVIQGSDKVIKQANKKISDPRMIKKLTEKFKNDPRYSHLNNEQLLALVEEVYKSVNSNTNPDDIGYMSTILISPKTFRGSGINKKDQLNFIKETIQGKKEAFKERPDKKQLLTLRNEIKEKGLSYESLNHLTESKYDKIDKFFKRRLGIYIDSEYLLTGSKSLRVKDLIGNNGQLIKDSIQNGTIINVIDSEGKNISKELKPEDILNDLKNRIKKDKQYENLIVDESVRFRINSEGKKEIFRTNETRDFISNLFKNLKETLPGNILFKGIDDYDPAVIEIIEEGKKSGTAYIQKITKKGLYTEEEFADNRTKSIMAHIAGKTYDVLEDEKGNLKLSNYYEKQKIVKGYKRKELQRLLGTTDIYNPEAYQGIVSKIFDINQDGKQNLLGKLKRKFTKFDDSSWSLNVLENSRKFLVDSDIQSYNLIDNIIVTASNNGISILEAEQKIFNDLKYTFNKLENDISGVTDNMLQSLLNNSNVNQLDKDLINNLIGNDIESFFKKIDNNYKKSIQNKDLLKFLERYKNDSEEVIHSVKTKHLNRSSPLKFLLGDNILDDEIQLDIYGQLKIEVVKDIFQRVDNYPIGDVNNVFNLIDGLNNLNDLEKDIFRDIGTISLFKKDISSDINIISGAVDNIFNDNSLGRYLNRVNESSELKYHFNKKIEKLKSEHGIFNDLFNSNINEMTHFKDFSDAMFINKSAANKIIIGQNLIQIINEGIKINGEEVKNFAKEFISGRQNPNNISEITLGINYMLNRLSYGIESVGLGLSDKSSGNALDSIKNIALKRLLPAMITYNIFQVADYESEKITGVSLKGVAANSIRNIDMGFRKILDKTHLSSAFNWLAETSVIHEYWTGQRHFNTQEEEQDWYDNGYTPVRGGRFWTFGSSSEFRGNDINYYQPNFLKRAHSNYHDVSVYGSIDEKWAHSWIPTLQHPLSPIRRLFDPYWLERKHLKENDRPYPLTAKMFSEGTPWGAVLNPTVGEMFKPVKMLRPAKRRLGKDGIDAQAIIEKINTRIKQRGNENDDLLVINGSDIRNAEYVPYGHPESDEINIITNDYGKAKVLGYNYMNSIQDLSEYKTPDGTSYYENEYGKANEHAKQVNGDINKILENVPRNEAGPGEKRALTIIKNINDAILRKGRKSYINRNIENLNNAPNKQEGTYIYRNLVNERMNFDEDFYTSIDTKNMVNKSKFVDYGKDAIYSTKQLSGIYGFLAEKIFGENAYTYRYENAGQMSSFTRQFWDSSVGGLGGGFMEIARRFFPSEDRKRININPLRNNMPDWIPDSYHMGDPYTRIPKGEMRLPGKGYETLNALHPDQFGNYGAFDRYKILADIAPNSAEYKKWKKIAENTITDEDLKKQMEDIDIRTSKMSGKHEFFDYKYIKNNTKYEKAVISEILDNGELKLANGQAIKLAGLKTTEESKEILKELLSPGDKVTVRTYKDLKYDHDEKKSIKEAVVYKNSENINQQLLDFGVAKENKSDNSPLAIMGRQSGMQETVGAALEIIGHSEIPFIHNKFLKIESSLESYKNEQIYGSSFQTWDHPIKNFIYPAFNKQSGYSLPRESLALGYAAFHFSKISNKITDKKLHFASSVILSTLNPTAFVGGNVAAFFSGLTNKNINKSTKTLKTSWQAGAEIGTIIGAVKYGWDNADNPIMAISSFALAGSALSKNLSGLKGIFKDLDFKGGAIIGASVGIGISSLKNPNFDLNRMFLKKHVPKSTKKKWELDEYFDRLNYVKYMGLYKVASARAALFEKTPIRDIFKEIDKNKRQIAKLDRKEKKIADKQKTNLSKNQMKIEKIRQKRMALEENTNIFFKGGKYTKAAVAYKKKAESTIYGLDETATKDEILAAIPDQYKDHFKAFMEISNKKEQKRILKYVPEYLEKPLKIAWGEKIKKIDSNKKYFKSHKMPSATWRGWKPNINMKHVKIKTVENEGMIMSDFGYYDSEKSKASFEMAPDIENYSQKSRFSRFNMLGALHGVGLNVSNVTVEQTSNPGLWIVSDVTGSAYDVKKAAKYQALNAINSAVNSIF